MYDAVVVGGGPAGSVSANLLARQGRRVLLLEAARFPRDKPCAEYISPGGVAILRRLGALDRLRGCWLEGMRIFAPSGASVLMRYAHPSRALSISRRQLDAVLLDLAAEQGVEIRQGHRVRGLDRQHGRAVGVVAANGEVVNSALVVGADGLHSVVARDLGVRRRTIWPRRLGLVGHLSGVRWPFEHGEMRVGQAGYVGVAPVDDGLVSVGLVRALPRQPAGSASTAFRTALDAFPDVWRRLGSASMVGNIQGVGPLAARVSRCAGPGWRLVGDAAGFFDPFTGEGIFRALRGAEVLASSTADCTYADARRHAFAAKERLTVLVQVFVQSPRLMERAVDRLQQRPSIARELSQMLGDLQPAKLAVAWRLLAP
jgi:geranylgeranyl reductase family protein